MSPIFTGMNDKRQKKLGENCALAANQSVGLPLYNPIYYWSKFCKGVKQGIQLACIRCPNAQFWKLLMNFDLKSKFMLSKTLSGWWRTLNTEYSAQGSNLRLMDMSVHFQGNNKLPCPILNKKPHPKNLLTAFFHTKINLRIIPIIFMGTKGSCLSVEISIHLIW